MVESWEYIDVILPLYILFLTEIESLNNFLYMVPYNAEYDLISHYCWASKARLLKITCIIIEMMNINDINIPKLYEWM